uniref:C-type lectin domain-containing protein n=1 Tax=Moschus moschiferus TaxID=68415 RepID=A0A8C6G0T5_MOSMO
MNNQGVTYVELKAVKSSKRQQMKPKISKSSSSITEQELTYAELNLQNAPQNLHENDKNYHSKVIHNLSPEFHCGCCPKEWFTYSNNCYSISLEKETLNGSLMSCTTKNSTLLYIDNEEEMKFLMSLPIISWIPVFREGRGHPWMWLNGTIFKLKIADYLPGEHNCAVLSSEGIKAEGCQSPNAYNCKHKFEN